MTTDRETHDRDELVSAAYRELGDDKAPERLNRAVLDMASAEGARRGRSRAILALWMKPVAWAATIGLCLAIVLEYSQIQSPVERLDVAPAATSVQDDFAPADKNILENANNRAKLQAGPAPVAVSEVETVESIDLATVESKGRVESFSASAPAASQRIAGTRSDFEAIAQPVITPDSVPEAAREPMPATLAEDKVDSDTANACNAIIRAIAADWLKCILDLRQSGFGEIADVQYEAFARKFPAESAEYDANK